MLYFVDNTPTKERKWKQSTQKKYAQSTMKHADIAWVPTKATVSMPTADTEPLETQRNQQESKASPINGMENETENFKPTTQGKSMYGNLKDRYDAYVEHMISLNLPYVDFDTWLNR